MSFTAITVDGGWQYLDEWRDTDGRVVEFGRIPLVAGELLPAGALDKEPPDKKRLTEASGNEGATYERSYHRAALVIWPAKRTLDVLLGAGVVAALPYLKRLAEGGKNDRPQAMAAARRILKAWPTGVRLDRYSIGIPSPGSSARTTMIAALVEMNSPALIEKFIREIVLLTYDGSENAVLLAAAGALENKKAAEILAALMETRMANRPNECAELLLALGETDPPPTFRLVAQAAVAGIDSIGNPVRKSEPMDEDFWWEEAEVAKKQSVPPEFVTNLFTALSLFRGRTLHDAAAAKLTSRMDVFDPVTIIVPAMDRLCAEPNPLAPAMNRVIQHLWASAAEFLLVRSEVPPQPPPDWRLQATLSCTCPDCADLQAFARDPDEQVHRFRINKERRRHLHQVIKKYSLDMTHVTVRVGSPQTLVCTKDRRTFEARMKEYRHEIAAMRKLGKLAPKSTAAPAIAKRLEAAVKSSTI